MSLSRVTKLLVLAASATMIGSYGEAAAATINAARIAGRCGLDINELADAHNVSLLCTLEWTEEKAPAVLFTCAANITCVDGSTLNVYEAPEGIYIERMASEAEDFHYLGRGFWRDCEIQEAVYFAREAWGC
jgi:hypothetical protein